jgi:hypothetical protein
MSLKAFHIAFIALAILLALGFALWMFLTDMKASAAARVTGGGCSIIVASALTAYGIRFLKKLKHVGYL